MLRRLRRLCGPTVGGVVFLLALAPMGCGSAGSRHAEDKAIVKGKVTLANQPLQSGLVVFTAASGWTERARIRPDGTYMIRGVPVGEVKIGVTTTGAPGGGKENRGKRESVPPRYKDPQTSGLTFTVTAPSEQEKNIELTP